MNVLDAVVFDLDNTLCRHTGNVEADYRLAFERADTEPFGEPDALWAALDGPPDPTDRVGYLGAGFARVAAQCGRSDADPIALARALTEIIDDGAVSFLPGAREALDRARSHGPVGILTNGPAARQRPKVRTLGLDECVETVVYAGDHPRRKPHVDPFDVVLDRLGTRAKRTLYVGDSLAYDVAGAHNAGLPVAWLAGGDDPGRYRPEYVLESISELAWVLSG